MEVYSEEKAFTLEEMPSSRQVLRMDSELSEKIRELAKESPTEYASGLIDELKNLSEISGSVLVLPEHYFDPYPFLQTRRRFNKFI